MRQLQGKVRRHLTWIQSYLEIEQRFHYQFLDMMLQSIQLQHQRQLMLGIEWSQKLVSFLVYCWHKIKWIFWFFFNVSSRILKLRYGGKKEPCAFIQFNKKKYFLILSHNFCYQNNSKHFISYLKLKYHLRPTSGGLRFKLFLEFWFDDRHSIGHIKHA